jgi:hypothetical protein
MTFQLLAHDREASNARHAGPTNSLKEKSFGSSCGKARYSAAAALCAFLNQTCTPETCAFGCQCDRKSVRGDRVQQFA